jgi:hypothetical protein
MTIVTGTTAESSRTMFITVVPDASTCRAYPVTVRIAAVLLLAAVAAGCGGHRSVLDGGVSPANAHRDVAAARREWLGEVRANARRYPRVEFRNLSHSDFVARLDRQARLHDFRIISIDWRRGHLDVPDVTIASTHYLQLAHDLPHVLDLIDPPPRSNHRAYEAIFLEAVDGDGVPFVAVYDSLRGHIMGGQWARSDALFPYAHG